MQVDLHQIGRPAGAGERPPGARGGGADHGAGPDPRDYDLLGVGSPSYYYRAPFAVVDYLRALPPLGGRPAFTFVLHGTHRGRVGNEIRDLLARVGARDAGFYHCRGVENYLGYVRHGYRFSVGHPTEGELAEARAFGERMAAAAAGGGVAPEPRDPRTPLVYALERVLTGRGLADRVYSRSFKVDSGRCTGCGLCAEACPVSNITLAGGPRPCWGDYCLLCFACEVVCPEEAIRSACDWVLFQPVFRYNVWRARRHPEYAAERVRLRGGRVEPV